MVQRILNKLSFANVMAVIAVFIAIGGSAYAAKKLNGKTLKRNSVAAAKLKCPSAAPTRVGALCVSNAQNPTGWISASQSGCLSQGLRLPSNGEALLALAAVGGESWADDIIVEGLAGSATRVQNGIVFSTPIAEAHGFRCVTTAG